MADPRLEVIDKRIAGVRRIVAVSSGKGGVGKSLIAVTLALILRQRGHQVGLLDLDFTSPSTHVILGVEGLQPMEEKGIIPPLAHGMRFMSIVYYAIDEPAPLRGADISNAIIELMAITRWGELDYLIIDMPPGISDATLDIIRLTPGIRFLLVTTPSMVAFETVRKLFKLLKGQEVPVIGVVENMVMKPSSRTRDLLEGLGASYLGVIAFDPELEEALGDVERLTETRFAMTLAEVVSEVERRIH